MALNLGLKDFEDSIQIICATINQLDAIITRNRKDFLCSNLSIYSPMELLKQLWQKILISIHIVLEQIYPNIKLD